MPYYHVLIKTNEPSEEYYQLDKTDLSKIKEKIVVPYLKGDGFFFEKRFLDESKVKDIIIKRSDCTAQEYANMWNQVYPNIIHRCSKEGILWDNDSYVQGIFKVQDIFGQICEEYEDLIEERLNKSTAPVDKSKVFIVHGHDNAAKEAVARFVEKIGLEAIILHEQVSSGNTIIEKIEANSNVGFAIVLYTPCDVGASKGEQDRPKPRARQNVIFEHGYLIGKIGRKNVCALVKGDIEKPTDISGVVYIPMDEGDGWKLAVGKEMKACGYEFDPSKLLK